MKSNEKGITLVVLSLIIIVLLVLVGILFSMVITNNEPQGSENEVKNSATNIVDEEENTSSKQLKSKNTSNYVENVSDENTGKIELDNTEIDNSEDDE